RAAAWTARRRAPQPSCSTRARSAATSPAGAFVRSRSTCQRMAGSPSSSQSITLTTAGYPFADGGPAGGRDARNRVTRRDRPRLGSAIMGGEEGLYYARDGAPGPDDLGLAWDAAERYAVGLLREALPEAQAVPVPVGELTAAAARSRSAVRKW